MSEQTGSRPITTLADLREGQSAVVVGILGLGALKQRLLEMGLIKGVTLTVERYAPLEDPVQITVKGYALALRVSEARCIQVEVPAG